jgi:hypothetical protein
MQESREPPRWVEPFRREIGPAFFLQDPTVGFVPPVDLEHLALRVVVGTSEPDKRGLTPCLGLDDLLDQPSSRPDMDQLTNGWVVLRQRSDGF